jgi:hypothetical protein
VGNATSTLKDQREGQGGISNSLMNTEYWGHLCELVQMQVFRGHNVHYSNKNIAEIPIHDWSEYTSEMDAFIKGLLKKELTTIYDKNKNYWPHLDPSKVDFTDPIKTWLEEVQKQWEFRKKQ